MVDNDHDEYTNYSLKYLQKLIDLYFFDSQKYNTPQDITLDNIQDFIQPILEQYYYYNLCTNNLFHIGDALEVYIRRAFADQFDGDYPNFPQTDKRALILFICDRCLMSSDWSVFPEDIPFILECINAPGEECMGRYEILDKYFEQFDRKARYLEEDRRWEAIKRERMEALEKGEPLPIRPMSIELDPCYKK